MMEPPYRNTDGTSSRTIAIMSPGRALSQPPMATSASYVWPRTVSSTESAIVSRLTSEDFMPAWPIAMPSVTVIVVNSRGVPPAAVTPRLAASA
jgi:hypothetical protein